MRPREIQLTRGMVALVDPIDFRRVIKHKWCVHMSRAGKVYAQCNMKVQGRWVRVLLHRFLMDATRGVQIDHRNGNGLDCTRDNLRAATHSQNMHNQRARRGTSRFKGVSWHTGANRWVAQICVGRKKQYLGLHDTEEQAAHAYDEAAKRMHGEFARLNF